MLSRALQRVSVRPIQVLLAALLLVPLLAFGSPPGPASSGMAVAGGIVTSATGTAMPGVTVDLYAWPSDAVQKALKPGQFVPTKLLTTAITNGAGKYMLMVPAAKLKAAAVESGYANLEITSAVVGMWFLSYQTSSLPAHPSAPVTVNLNPAIGVRCPKDQLGRQTYFSGFFKIKQLKPAWAIIGQGYINRVRKTRGDSMVFDYNQTATKSQTSALGVGISGHGIDAGYNTSGTSTSTATAGQSYPTETKSTLFRTWFNVAMFRGTCHGGSQDNSVQQLKQHGYCPRKWEPLPSLVYYTRKCFWMAKSVGWFGPSESVIHPTGTPRTPGGFCGPILKNGKAYTHNQQAIQWSSGFTIGVSDKIRGATLKADFSSSAQTGYDRNAKMVFTFAHAGWICGTNHDPNSAALLVMRSNKT